MSDVVDAVYINEEEGKKRVMNNTKLYAKLLTKFKTDINLNDFLAFADAQDWENAQAAIHSIKGIAANLSLPELFLQSLDLETQMKGARLKPESIDKYKSCFAETLIQVEKVVAKNA